MTYLLDSDVFIQAKNLHYGFDFCPAFWDWIDERADGSVVQSIDKVRDELLAGQDELTQWARARGSDFFLPPDAPVLNSLRETSNWASSGKYAQGAVTMFLNSADYYLVSHAHAHQHVVVTHEVPSDSVNRIKIPDACISLGVKCVTPFEMLRVEHARFVLD